jgi:2-oxoisovalerate dehydrogenase E1 component alpha subunit
VLVEAITFRVGHHSTSDDSTRYKDKKEMEKWNELITHISNPITRFEKYLLRKGLIKESDHKVIRDEVKE